MRELCSFEDNVYFVMVTSTMMSAESYSFSTRFAWALVAEETNRDQPCVGTRQQRRGEVRFRML